MRPSLRRPAAAAFAAILATASLSLPATALAGPLAVPIDHTVRLGINGPAASVVVGNPAIADVHVVDSHTVFVAGRGFGSTDITVLDSLGRTLYSGDIEVSPPKKGRVAVFRGAARTDLSCDPSCGPVVAAGASTAAPAAAGTATTAASTAASLPSSMLPPFASGGAGAGGPR